MEEIKRIFNDDWCGIESFLQKVLVPIFGKMEQKYDILTTDKETKEKAFHAKIETIRNVASFTFYGNELNVYDVQMNDNADLQHSRVDIQAIIRKYIVQFDGAIIVFHYKDVGNKVWRLSYVERGITQKQSTSPKRYTYILGKNQGVRTACERFEVLLQKKDSLTTNDLTEAFSIESLSTEFFDKYREKYADFVEYITGTRYVKEGGKFVEKKTGHANAEFKVQFNSDDKAARDYVKKLFGRIVFLYFLQKKGWIGVDAKSNWGQGDRDFMSNLWKNTTQKNDYLEHVLEPLFFSTLNERRTDDFAPKAICEEYGKKIKIPYLNGGLFERDSLDDKIIKFPKEKFDDLFTFFSKYNFTIDETDLDDIEVGVNPEMLGKIFENLLEDNKDKGAFYTPKEIVQYMCKESLIAYLQEKTGYAEKDLRVFVEHAEVSCFNEREKAALLKVLLDVKVCDPAVGSGAFPMGMLNFLFACISAIEGEAKSRSEIKKHIVKNNIYGVDIEKGAVDIARLRFWLAIVVDEEEPLPFPNLDYKIMQGNSLIESYEGVDLSKILEKPVNGELDYCEEQRTLLNTNMQEYFDENNHANKKEKDDIIKDIVFELVNAKCGFKNNSEKSLDLHDKIHNGTTEFFLWHTWFSDVFNRPSENDNAGGFDIVIGNPPYGAKVSEKEKKYYREHYAAAKTKNGIKGSTDTFTVFIEMGHDLLKTGGNLAFIVPMSVTSSDAMCALHNKIEKDCGTIRVSSFSRRPRPIFENATVRPSIILFTRDGKQLVHLYTTNVIRRGITESIQDLINKFKFVESFEVKRPGRYPKIGNQIGVDIIKKCMSFGNNISSYKKETGDCFYYRTSGGEYWNCVTPYSTGSTKERPFYCDYNNLFGLILSSSVFYFYQQVYTDGLDLKQSEIENFYIPNVSEISKDKLHKLEILYKKYLNDIENNANVRKASKGSRFNINQYKEYKIVKSYSIIRQIDDEVCKLYGLTPEETTFIKNYELEARMAGAE